MILTMSRPWKHPDSGVYYFRKAVPDDLRVILGKREEKRSLRTRDAQDARRQHVLVAAEVDREWVSLRKQQAALSAPPLAELDDATIRRVGQAYYVYLLEEDDEQRLDGFAVSEQPSDVPTPTFDEYVADSAEFDASARYGHARGQPDAFYLSEVDEVLLWEGIELRLDPASPSRKRLARELQAATIRAAKVKEQRNQGEPVETPDYPPPLRKITTAGSLTAAQPLLTLFADWWREGEKIGLKSSTHDNYRNTINQFVAFLGHDDAAQVTPHDVVRFKDHRLLTVSAKTVKDGDLAALKAVLGWSKANHRLLVNAAEGITLKLKKRRKGSRPKSFTDDEAKALLKASDNYQRKPREKFKLYLAKRWVPWLCAYTGARVGEIIQLRKQDVRQEAGHYVAHINPEAGTVKTDEPRDVVLHAHLVDKGFPELLASSAEGYLFIDPAKDGKILGALKSRRNDMAEFARETVKDPDVQPNHGWRHRFTKVWMEAGLPERTMDYIEGHAPLNVSRKDYADDNTIKAQLICMVKFPRQGD